MRLAVGEGVQCTADALMSANAKLAEAFREDRLGYGCAAVEASGRSCFAKARQFLVVGTLAAPLSTSSCAGWWSRTRRDVSNITWALCATSQRASGRTVRLTEAPKAVGCGGINRRRKDMTITLFENRNRRGSSRRITTDLADLRNMDIDKPGSIAMTAARDAVLLFKNDDWRGGVHYLSGARTIDNLGSPAQGGRNTFGNSIRSVRVSPFTVDLNITVVKNNAGDLPGPWTTERLATRSLSRIVFAMNAFLRGQQALLQVTAARITFRTDENRFVLRRNQGVPGSWKERSEIDVIIVDRFENEGLFGTGAFPHGGQTVRIAGKLNPSSGSDVVLTQDFMALVLMHELGHYLGLAHGTSNNDGGNLMFPSADQDTDRLTTKTLTTAQIREMHQKLARNPTRRRDRN